MPCWTREKTSSRKKSDSERIRQEKQMGVGDKTVRQRPATAGPGGRSVTGGGAGPSPRVRPSIREMMGIPAPASGGAAFSPATQPQAGGDTSNSAFA